MSHRLRLLVFLILRLYDASSKEVLCVSDVAFTIITEIFNNSVDINVRLYCPVGYHCVSHTDTPCQPNVVPWPTTNRPRKTGKIVQPTSIGEPINCHGPGYHPATKCNEYIECAPLYLWFKAERKKCKEGYFYSEVNKPCSMPPNVVCTHST